MYTTPFLDLPPLVSAQGTVRLPGSKSISNRVLLLAGLSEGTTRVLDVLASDDTRVMLDALRALGCTIAPDGDALLITGLGGQLAVREAQLFLGNAGTAMRPLTAALALLATTQGGVFELSGVPRMHERPIGDLIDALRPLGCRIDCLGTEGYPPLRLNPGTLDLSAPIRVRGDVSSQFLTALLLALPLVAQGNAGPSQVSGSPAGGGPGAAQPSGHPVNRDLSIEVVGELISKPYIEITLNLLARFGIEIVREGWSRFTIPAGSRYRSPGEIPVEGDASSASYFIAAGALAATEAPIRIEGVGSASIQGDIRFVEAARAMGADIVSGTNTLEIRRGTWPLRAITLDCNHIPDAAMTLAVMALYANGTTRLTNIASWRVKETDRIEAMAAELRKLGAEVEAGEDFIAITPPQRWQPAAIHTYDDHRMAMCFSLAAFNPLAGNGATGGQPVRILDPQCVGKTYPDYFEHLFQVVRAGTDDIPVLTIDGPTASGKGTLASEVAARLGYHLLDSGALYRATALAASRLDVPLDDEVTLARLAGSLKLRFDGPSTWLDGEDVTLSLREEEVGRNASRISAFPAVRQALHELQLSFRALPGLVADGRDMGTVLFPTAPLKVFLTASVETRAKRRYNQLISKGFSANLSTLLADLEARDVRDRTRSVAPLKPAEDARLLDNSASTIEESVEQVLAWWQASRPFS